MRLTEGEIHGFPLLAIEGELDHSSKDEVRDAVDSIVRGAFPPQNLLFDLTDCEYMDSAGLSILFSAMRSLPDDGWLGLIGVAPQIKRVLTYAGMLDLERVRFFSSMNDTAASLGREDLMPLTPEPGPADYEKPPDVWERWEQGEPL